MSLLTLLPTCSQDGSQMHDGYYTAEAVSFDAHDWKDFVTIYVSSNKIVTVEFNSKNPSGFIKSWDIEYIRRMKADLATYPNKYSRAYIADLLNRQDPEKIKPVPGAEFYHRAFQRLAKAAIQQARAGNRSVALVELSDLR